MIKYAQFKSLSSMCWLDQLLPQQLLQQFVDVPAYPATYLRTCSSPCVIGLGARLISALVDLEEGGGFLLDV